MVRWSDGLFGGLLAGTTSALFYALVAVVLKEYTIPAFFAQIAQALPPFHAAPAAGPIVALGVVLHFAVAAGFGIAYAMLARRFPSMWHAPTSVMWGCSYGLLVWWCINDVVVPISGAVDVQPLWEGLVGTVLFYGVVLSEYTTVAHRGKAAAAAAETVAP